jgi:hypothetical protein
MQILIPPTALHSLIIVSSTLYNQVTDSVIKKPNEEQYTHHATKISKLIVKYPTYRKNYKSQDLYFMSHAIPLYEKYSLKLREKYGTLDG